MFTVGRDCSSSSASLPARRRAPSARRRAASWPSARRGGAAASAIIAFSARGERARLVGEAVDGRIVAVGGDQRGERLHQVPRRAVHARLVAGVDVLARAAAPASRRSRPARARPRPWRRASSCTLPSRSCAAARHEDARRMRLSAASTSGRRTICGKCGEPISSSPSATSTRLTGSFARRRGWRAAPRGTPTSGPFWLTAPRPIIDFAEAGLVDERRLERRRRPLRRDRPASRRT